MGSHEILHSFDHDDKEVIQRIEADRFSKKIIAVERILSISEKFILTSYAFDRIIYWEYEEDYDALKKMLMHRI